MSSLFCCPVALTWLYVGTRIWTQVRTLAKRALPRTEPPLLCTLNHLQRLANTMSTLRNSYTALLETGKKATCAHSVPVQLFATTLLCIWTWLAPQIQDACTQRADLYNPSTERLRGGKKPRFWEMVWVSPWVVVLFSSCIYSGPWDWQGTHHPLCSPARLHLRQWGRVSYLNPRLADLAGPFPISGTRTLELQVVPTLGW